MTEDKNIEVGGRLHSIATGNILAGAKEILDDDKNKKQSEINTETYSLVNDVRERLSGLSPDQQDALSVATKAVNNEVKLGYYVCDTAAATAEKVISDATGYVLSLGGSIKIKMTNDNTAADATLNINSTGAKPLYYKGERASDDNSWEAGETVEVYYDGTNFYANNVVGFIAKKEEVTPVGTTTIKPNRLYDFGVCESLSIAFFPDTSFADTIKEYMFEFVVSDIDFTLTLPEGVRWNTEPDWEPGNTYQVSILNNLAVYAEFEPISNE